MSSADIVIFKDVFMQNIIQVLFIENNHVVKAFSTKRANYSFAEWILPWASWCSWRIFKTKLSYGLLEFIAIDTIIITDNIFCGFIESKGFTKLLNCPLTVWL